MADVHESSVRSYNMSKIKGKDTKPEMIVRKYLFSNNYRYRLHDKRLSGKPDIVLKKYNTVIFVHGCFWHKHDSCKYFIVPKTRTDWWLKKINKNVENDHQHYKELKRLGWNIIIIWECELRPKNREATLELLLKSLENELNKA